MITMILESALRSLVMAATAWAALRLLRVSHVIAQKIAWGLVLLFAIAMPFVMRLQPVKVGRAVELPAYPLSAPAPRVSIAPATQRTAAPPSAIQIATTPLPAADAAPVQRSLPDLRSLIIPAYLTVFAILMLRLLFGVALAVRVWHRAQRASALIDPRATVRISSDISTPVTIGSGIVLPASFKDWGAAKLRIVLAHERSHVNQADFYLQLLARLHTAIFWFSPLAWWLQKKLSDLGEAISDRAGMQEASSPHTYAEVLLEFAAMPRRPLVGVAMARSSRVERRIDRLLTDSLFRRAFGRGKVHAWVAAAIVPIAVLASTSLVVVRAAEAGKTTKVAALSAVILHHSSMVADTSKPVAAMRASAVPSAHAPGAAAAQEPGSSSSSSSSNSSNENYNSDSNRNSYAIVSGDSQHTISFNGDSRLIDKAKAKYHGNYILAERDGKAYVIDDPALVAESQQMIKPMEELGRRQEELGAKQEALGKEQERLGRMQEQAAVPTPDMSKEIAELQAALKKLQDLKQSQTVKQGDLAEIQEQVGALQGKLGSIEGQLGEQQGKFGEQQGKLGEEQGKLGEQQGKLGEQQGRLAEALSQKMKLMVDQAIRDGKTKPLE